MARAHLRDPALMAKIAAVTARTVQYSEEMALQAGCDMVLICNNRPAAWQIVRGLRHEADPVSQARLARMHGLHPVGWNELHDSPAWRQAAPALP